MVNRGWHKELDVADERGLYNDYQGCLTDFCPVGALTWNDFRFQKRSWFLDKKASICDRCSKGCNIEVHSDKDIVYRYVPVFNELVNGHWMCDEGRSSFADLMNPKRVISPLLNHNGAMTAASLETVLGEVKKAVASAGSVQLVVGTDATREEAALLKDKSTAAFGKPVTVNFHNGYVRTAADDKKLDALLRMADKTPNTKGVEETGLVPLANGEATADLVILFRNGRAGVPKLAANQKVVLWGVWTVDELKALPTTNVVALIPGLATIEKEGSFKNADGVVQKFHPAIQHRGGAVSAHQVIGLLTANK
jgi:NADH-quinone oxidoreductase subunit G